MKMGWIIVGIVALLVAGALVFGRNIPARGTVAGKTVQGRAPNASDVDLFLEPYRAQLEASRRPLARISLEPMTQDDLRTSKVGGRPYWREGKAVPTGSDGKPLYLLAQINFSEIPRTLPGYPSQGLLQFFIADNDHYGADFKSGHGPDVLSVQRDFRVVYWPDIAAAPIDTAVPPQFHGSPMLPHDPARPRRMSFEAGEERLSIDDYRFEKLLGGNTYGAVEAFAASRQLEADALFDALWERYPGSGHKLGGYPYFTQGDPRTQGPMELLLQLDSDDQMMWGDVGVGGFFIAPADLAKADFSRVMYTWDCH